MTAETSRVVVRNIYYMMAYAFNVLTVSEYARLATEEFDGVEDLMAAILAIGIDTQRKRGFERDYTAIVDEIRGIKGKVDIRSTAKSWQRGSELVTCEWDELAEDTYKNRILKTIGSLLVASEVVSRERRLELKRSLIPLRDVSLLDPSRIKWNQLRYHRNNATYQLLMNVCYMVAKSMIISNGAGDIKLVNYSDSQQLHALYESFVLAYFRRHHPELNPKAKEIRLSSTGDIPSFLPRLKSDVTLQHAGRTLIIDCKCYGKILRMHYDKEIASPANLNQIVRYVTNEAYGNDAVVSGMLLYALTDSDETQRSCWNEAGHDYCLWTLDLNREFEGIASQLELIAKMV